MVTIKGMTYPSPTAGRGFPSTGSTGFTGFYSFLVKIFLIRETFGAKRLKMAPFHKFPLP
jgi:hypothetical protein